MNKERENEILRILLAEKRIYVRDIAKRTYSSEPSIRRDLENLERRGFLRRIHGGAILDESANSEVMVPFELREMEQSDAKSIIAKKAASLLVDGSVVMLDASTSTYHLVPFISAHSDMTVITSGVKALAKLGEYGVTVHSTGGLLVSAQGSLVGDDACTTIDNYNADIVFFSCRGLSLSGNITDISIDANVVRRKMMHRSKTKVLLCDTAKLDKEYYHNLCSVADIDYVVSDAPLPESITSLVKTL